MKITKIETTPVRIPFRKPYHWGPGVIEAAETVLVSIHTDEGLTGYGEAMSSTAASALQTFYTLAAEVCMGRDPLHINALHSEVYGKLFANCGNLGGRRFAATILAGLDMALWDIAGKAANLPVHGLLGGAVRNSIKYFGFPQGDDPEEIARNAKAWVSQGCDVIYVKVGRGVALDYEIVRQVRAAIGGRRLRLDANEVWDVLTARRMIRLLRPFDIEFLEQPTPGDSLSALKSVREGSTIPVAADQLVYSPEDTLEVCRVRAADMIVIGLHEAGSMNRLLKSAAIAEAAGINICLHGLYETGITTCATFQAGMVIPNLDDGNQFMNHLLVEDIIRTPDLSLKEGCLPMLSGPGLGFDLDWDAVARAEECHRQYRCKME